MYDESQEDAEAGASETVQFAALADCGQPGDGRFWRNPGDAMGDPRRAGGRISGSRKAQKNYWGIHLTQPTTMGSLGGYGNVSADVDGV